MQLKSIWLEHTAEIEINAPLDLVWNIWSDLKQIPRWIEWVDSVEVLKDNPQLSRWTLATQGVEFTWLSQITKLVPYQVIEWKSIEGSPNRGLVRFSDRNARTTVKFTVSYVIPKVFAQIVNNSFLSQVIELTIQNDLQRFKNYVSQVRA